jgi:hypothetical protein
MKHSMLILAGCVLLSFGAHAEDCSNYPYSQNMNIEDTPAGLKIIATAVVGVDFDDVDSVNDAREKATNEAKAMISKFMNESINSDSEIKEAVKTTKSMQGESKAVKREEVSIKVKNLATSSKALLRGVAPLGECYTKAREFRVSVGVKPETIAGAAKMSGQMGSVPATSSAGGQQDNAQQGQAQQAPVQTTPLNRTDGFSNSKGLSKF